MQHLTKNDLKAWVTAVTHPLASSGSLIAWVEGPLRAFFPFKGVVLGHGELVAGQLVVTHMLAAGHDDAYLRQIATTFELSQRASLAWWFSTRRPFHIDPDNPPPHAGAFELRVTAGARAASGTGAVERVQRSGTVASWCRLVRVCVPDARPSRTQGGAFTRAAARRHAAAAAREAATRRAHAAAFGGCRTCGRRP